jgi:hypothetical protein
MMLVTEWPIEPAVSRTCSTTRLITLRLGWVLIAGAFFAVAFFFTGLAAFLATAARRCDPARFLLVRRFAEALREAARRFEDFFDDFFDDRERFDADFVERSLEEDRRFDAMGFLLFSTVQSGLM